MPMQRPSPTLSSRLAARLAPWVLRRLDASWALRLLREAVRRLSHDDDGALVDALLVACLNDLDPHARRVGLQIIPDTSLIFSGSEPRHVSRPR
mgnify:CR=1 FL=1